MGTIIGLMAIWLMYQHYSQDLPGFSKLENYKPPTVTRLYSEDGRLMEEYAVEKRLFLPMKNMPKMLVHAFLSAEDKNFYQHQGIDWRGLARAVVTNLQQLGDGRSPVGGSTITQQVIKNFLLSNEKTIERKMKEAILSFRVSKSFSKDQILELYLNQIYLGSGSYGVAAAALNYFNKSVDDLSLEEAAFLAALPKAPSTYNPRTHYDRAKERRDWVLSRMAEDGVITPAEARTAQAKPITLIKRDADEVAPAGFFAEEVRRELVQRFGNETVYQDGLYVQTTLNTKFQRAADRALRYGLEAYDKRHGYRGATATMKDINGWAEQLRNLPQQRHPRLPKQRLAVVISLGKSSAKIGFADGSTGTLDKEGVRWTNKSISKALQVGDVVLVEKLADAKPAKGKQKAAAARYLLTQTPRVNGALVVMENATGRVLAMSGGYQFGSSVFNRATQAKRQPGSAIKPFVYLAALEAGYRPNTIIMDEPIELSQGAGKPLWRPENYSGDYLGAVPMRVGLEKSRNTMTVKLAVSLGVEKALETSKRFHIYDEPQRMFSTVLGAQETTLMRMVTAYAELANGGKKVVPSLIERVDNRDGKVILKRDVRACTACRADADRTIPSTSPAPALNDNRVILADARTNFQLVNMLRGVVERGTAQRAKRLERPLGGKTGTTNDSRDAWFIGFSPEITVGVYIGYDTPRSLGKRESGSSVALPAFIKFFEIAQKDAPVTDFTPPEGIVMRPVYKYTGQVLPEGFESEDIVMEAFKVIQDDPLPWQYEQEALPMQQETPYYGSPQPQPLPNAPPPAVESPRHLPWLAPKAAPMPFGAPSQPLTPNTLPPSRYAPPAPSTTPSATPPVYVPQAPAPATLEFLPPPTKVPTVQPRQ